MSQPLRRLIWIALAEADDEDALAVLRHPFRGALGQFGDRSPMLDTGFGRHDDNPQRHQGEA